MLASDQWSPALTKKLDSPTLPTAYQAMLQQAFTAALKQGDFLQRGTGGGTGTGRFSGTCHNCGEVGHMSRNCPKQKQGGGSSNNSGSTAWKLTYVTKTVQKFGRTYKWCQKCADGKGQYMYHLTAGHDAWQARRNAEHSSPVASGDPPLALPVPDGAQGYMATSGSLTDDFIGFGGLLLPSKE